MRKQEQRQFPQNYEEHYGIQQEVAEIRGWEQRSKDLQQRIEEKKRQKQYETEVETLYYKYVRSSPHEYVRFSPLFPEQAPPSLALLPLEERHELVKKLLHLDQKPLQEINGEIQWQNGPVFQTSEYNPIQNRGLENPRITSVLEDIVTYQHCTWNVVGNEFTIRDYGDCLHFYLTWPKGDGSDYVIFDLEHHQEQEIRQRIEQLKHLGTWAYGSLKEAYKTKDNLAVLKFYLRAD